VFGNPMSIKEAARAFIQISSTTKQFKLIAMITTVAPFILAEQIRKYGFPGEPLLIAHGRDHSIIAIL
jgi:hypothetical protein